MRHRHKWLPIGEPDTVRDHTYHTYACAICLERKSEFRKNGTPVYCAYEAFGDLDTWQREVILQALGR
jgi:hypothetical protein